MMSTTAAIMVFAGALVGVGVAVVIAGALPSHPALADALARLDERGVSRREEQSGDPPSAGWRPAARALCLKALARLPVTVPERDLDILDWTRDRYLLGRVTTAATYAAAGPVLVALTTLLDAGLPIVIPTAFGALAGIAGWVSYANRVRAQAEDARGEMRYALVAYLQQVSLLRRGGAGVSTALNLPARLLDDTWAMRRIRDQLELAERAGLMPWDGLRRFGEQVEITELADLSTIAETAGYDGGAVVDTLLARAESLHDELLADEHTDANRASARMSTPGALQVFLIAGWVLYPAVVALLG